MESEIARCLHGGDEFSIAFKVSYISEDLFTGNGNFSLYKVLCKPNESKTYVVRLKCVVNRLVHFIC